MLPTLTYFLMKSKIFVPLKLKNVTFYSLLAHLTKDHFGNTVVGLY